MYAKRAAAVLLVGGLLPWMALPAQGVATPGTAVALVAPEQRIRENSTAVAVFGFSFSSTGTETLDNITVFFGGTVFYNGDNRTLRALNRDGALSGVALYRDDGVYDDVLDAADRPVFLDDIFWSGNYLRMVLSNHTEFIPTPLVGAYGWFIVIRTGMSNSYLIDGFSLYARLYPGAVVATNGSGFVSLPSTTITTNNMVIRHTRATNMVSAATSYIGPGSAAVHERAVLGLTIVDGVNGSFSGIDDRVTRLELRITQMSGNVTTLDFAPVVTDSAVSGIGFYRDTGPVNDDWDPGDSPVRFGSIQPETFGGGSATGVTIAITFSPPLEAPGSENGLLDFFFVVRSGMISSADSMRFAVVLNSVGIDGVLPADKGRTAMAAYNTSSSTLFGDNTPPSVADLWWGAADGPYMTTAGPRRLLFNNEMVAPVRANAFATLSDPGSGLMNMTWSSNVGLDGPTPAAADLFGSTFTIRTAFDIGSGSAGTSGQLNLVACDRVGNCGSALEQRWNVTYRFEPRVFFIEPAPGWYGAAGDGLYIDVNGTLWFSDRISGTSTAWVGVNVSRLYGTQVDNITASEEPQLSPPSNADDPLGAGNVTQFFATQYGFWANSSQGRGAVTISVRVGAGTLGSLDFPIRQDNAPPVVSIESPGSRSVLSQPTRVWASAVDTGGGVARAWLEQRPAGYSFPMYADEEGHYFVDIVPSLFEDGAGRLVVTAEDHVGNVGSAWVDVFVQSSGIEEEPPRVALASPAAGTVLAGSAALEVAASDAAGLAAVWVRVDEGEWVEATLDPDTGYFTWALDTDALADGSHTVRASARDVWGNEAETGPVEVTVDNGAPQASLVAPLAGAVLRGSAVVRVYAFDAVGIREVTLDIDGRTVPLAPSAASGYYEYVLDTQSLSEGEHRLRATVVDVGGKRTLTEEAAFTVQNRDDMGAIVQASPFLLFLFALAAFVAAVLLVRGVFVRRWMSPEAVRGRGGEAGPAAPASVPAPTPASGPPPSPEAGAAPAGDRVPCPTCGTPVGTGWRFCPQCKQELVWG